MKGLILGLLITVNCAFASTPVLVKSSDKDYDLGRIPQNLMATFIDQNFNFIMVSKNVYDLTIRNLRCDYYSRDGMYPDYSNAGLPKVNCYVNAVPEMGGKGIPVLEGRYILELMDRLQSKTEGEFSDCSMGGKCVTFVKEIKCISDLNHAEMKDAYSCYFR